MNGLEAFAEAVIDAHRTGRRFTPGTSVPGSPAEAYAVQRAVMDRIGPAAAYKTARKPGADPIMAPIARAQIHDGDAAVGMGRVVGVELEVGLEALVRIPKGTAPDRLAAMVRPRAAIELVDTRIDGPAADDPIVKLADQQACGALIVGTGTAAMPECDLDRVTARLRCGDTVVLDGPATIPGGSALASLAAFLDLYDGGLRPGEVVITGSLNGLPRFPPGTPVHGEIEGVGSVAVDIV